MQKIEPVRTFDQIKLLADSRRMEILRLLMAAPATLTHLARTLKQSPAWVKHHILALEAGDLIEVSEIRRTGKVTEKFYRAKGGAFLLQEIVLPKSKKPALIFSGSHDLALEEIAGHLGKHVTLLSLSVGSLDGLVNLRQGLCQISGAHILDETGEYNTPTVRHLFPDRDVELVTLAYRTQGLMLTAGNPKGLSPLINEAEEKGVRVVCVSTDAPESRRSTIVCVEPWLNGHLAGELMGKFVPANSKVGVVAGMLRALDHRKKTDGFSDAFRRQCPGGEIVDILEGHEDEDESFQKTFDLLGRVPDLAGLYVNTVNCLPVCRALGARGLAGKVRLIATDLFSEMARYFEKGTISASIYQQPYRQGQTAVRLIADHLSSKATLPPTVHLSPGVVMSSNLQLFREMRISPAPLDDSMLREGALLRS